MLYRTFPDFSILSLIFWATLLIYQLNTKIKFNVLNIDSYKLLVSPIDKKVVWTLFLGGITVAHVIFLNPGTIVFLVHLGIISTLYNVPEKSEGCIHFPLRSIPVLKVFLIAYVWSSMSSFLPAVIANDDIFTSANILLFVAHLLFIISITLPFDIRDFEEDNLEDIVTFPQLIGIVPTKLLAMFCLIIFTLIIQSIVGGWYVPIFSLVVGILILNSSSNKKDYYYTFYLDGTIIIYWIAISLSLG